MHEHSCLLQAQTLSVEFKKPWNSLAEINVVAHRADKNFLESPKWWSLLEEARTFFDENPS